MNEQKEKKKYPRKREIYMRFMVDEAERDLMACDGRVIHVELDSVDEMIRLLSNATNNINQIARRANETGNIYAADLSDLRERYDELWGQTKEILRRLSAIV